ncbi:MAG: ribosome biogenesis GTPase Der [Anaerolineae bacterium]|jgi:GTP-binding protein|nr:ribosome biogenesis GTPase Der [Anaerolineae bacterium]
MAKSIVALVGRPNVGKSTLFNRLIGEKMAIVSDIPGTTRDRLYSDCIWNGVAFTLIDTGGMEILAEHRIQSGEPIDVLSAGSTHYIREIRAQAEVAIRESDVIVFLTDVQAGQTAADEEVANVLRRASKPVIVAANKADNTQLWVEANEFYALGVGPVFPVSALNGRGTGDLLDEIVASLPQESPEDKEPDAIKIAIVGRPNVGKSSLLNKLLREERSIVSPIAGTTRDAIDTPLRWEGLDIVLIDTAGIRRRGKVEKGLEYYSVLRAMRAISRSDVVLLLVDATEGVTDQDAHIAGYILEEQKSVVVLVNKWDAIEKDSYTMSEYTEHVRQELKFLDYVPVLFISALTGQRVYQVIPTALEVEAERHTRMTTHQINKLIQDAIHQHSPPSIRGQRLKVYFVTQSKSIPPTFVFFVNDPELVHFGYQRFLENQIREAYSFRGTPLKLIFRAGQDRPYTQS